MQRQHPAPAKSLPISSEIYGLLVDASIQTGFQQEDWEIAALAIKDWILRQHPDVLALPAVRGFQWKDLFLPNGTILRTVFKGKNFHCRVEDDHLRYDGQSTSPSAFANAVGGLRRNAWKVIWVLLPDSQSWKLAASLRPAKRAKS
ncbi:MAG: hypothetical protein ABIT83_22735 [Massilia sp.]